MIQPITVLTGSICLAVLWLRYRAQPKKEQRKVNLQQAIKTGKLLFAALVALMAITYAMRSLGERLDGAPAHEPSLVERAVLYLSK
ncbi:MAG TPA: hypothetical protein VKX49_05460 [Bryobacteraceae bacterium]|nr:hypothetical protein [Bryobacteraceae bacterium]